MCTSLKEVSMIKTGEEILADIDHTLDQLISNVAILQQVSECDTFTTEYAILHKTQQSLTARVIHMETLLDETGSLGLPDTTILHDTIQKKIARYKRLNNQLIEEISTRFKERQANKSLARKPRIGRNRRSSFR